MLTHDYLSVALEFDDGQDLTWYWSSALPLGFAYRCPLKHWRHRETHVVARTGAADLGGLSTRSGRFSTTIRPRSGSGAGARRPRLADLSQLL